MGLQKNPPPPIAIASPANGLRDMNVGTSTSVVSIRQKIAAPAEALPQLAPTVDMTAKPTGPVSVSATGPAPTRLALKAPGTPAATSADGTNGSGGAPENPVVAILKEQIARLQKQLATEQKQLAGASKSTPEGGGPNVAVAGLQSEIQSTIAALLKATAALATYMSSASSGVDIHA